MGSRVFVFAVGVLAMFWAIGAGSAQPAKRAQPAKPAQPAAKNQPNGRDGCGGIVVSVVTQNLFVGADPGVFRFDQSNISRILDGIDTLFDRVRKTDINARAAAFARQIKNEPADVICLQEAVDWRTMKSAKGSDPDSSTKVSYAHVVLRQLAREGLDYEMANREINEDIKLPSNKYGWIRISDHNAILVRKGIKVVGKDAGHFDQQRKLEWEGYGFSMYRGWVSALLQKKNQSFNVINAHLETNRAIRQSQIKTIMDRAAAAAGKGLPLIVTGDFNESPDRSKRLRETIQNNGLRDIFRSLKNLKRSRGATCCRYPKTLAGRDSHLSMRVDLILASDHFQPICTFRLGAGHHTRAVAADGRKLWISDHSGVYARMCLAPAQE